MIGFSYIHTCIHTQTYIYTHIDICKQYKSEDFDIEMTIILKGLIWFARCRFACGAFRLGQVQVELLLTGPPGSRKSPWSRGQNIWFCGESTVPFQVL